MRPSIPVGLSTKLMIGRETSSPSRTIANEPENCSASADGDPAARAARWPRSSRRRRAGRSRAVTVGERLAALVGEVEGDGRLVELVGARLRVGDLVAGERRACRGGRRTASGRVGLVDVLGRRVVVGRRPRPRSCPAGPRSPWCPAAARRRRKLTNRSSLHLRGLADRLAACSRRTGSRCRRWRCSPAPRTARRRPRAASRPPRPRRSAGCRAAPPGSAMSGFGGMTLGSKS